MLACSSRRGFCSFLDKRTKIKTAEGLFAHNGRSLQTSQKHPESFRDQSFALLRSNTPLLQQNLESPANAQGHIFCQISSEADPLSKKVREILIKIQRARLILNTSRCGVPARTVTKKSGNPFRLPLFSLSFISTTRISYIKLPGYHTR